MKTGYKKFLDNTYKDHLGKISSLINHETKILDEYKSVVESIKNSFSKSKEEIFQLYLEEKMQHVLTKHEIFRLEEKLLDSEYYTAYLNRKIDEWYLKHPEDRPKTHLEKMMTNQVDS